MNIGESAEMYLETILILLNDKGLVRMIDVAEELGFSKPSVSVYLKKLRSDGYIAADGNGYLSLTDIGKEIAERTYDRHQSIAKFLIAIGVDEQTAAVDACKMEHIISDKTFSCMKEHYKKHIK